MVELLLCHGSTEWSYVNRRSTLAADNVANPLAGHQNISPRLGFDPHIWQREGDAVMATDGQSVPYEERVRLALEACQRDSISIREAAARYDVSRATFLVRRCLVDSKVFHPGAMRN